MNRKTAFGSRRSRPRSQAIDLTASTGKAYFDIHSIAILICATVFGGVVMFWYRSHAPSAQSRTAAALSEAARPPAVEQVEMLSESGEVVGSRLIDRSLGVVCYRLDGTASCLRLMPLQDRQPLPSAPAPDPKAPRPLYQDSI